MSNGKVVVITGASSGIGEATARLLAQKGAHVVLGARRIDRLQALTAAIHSESGSAVYRELDVTRRDQMEALVTYAKETFGRVDVVINNAGISPISPLRSLEVDDWNRMIDVNLRGVLYGIAAGLPIMEQQRSGHFVTIASTSAYRVVPTQAVYSATKSAVRAISEGLRQEVGSEIRVTIISPGMIDTELTQGITNDEAREAMKGRLQMAIPPIAIAQAILFAIEQPAEVDVNEIIVRPTAQA